MRASRKVQRAAEPEEASPLKPVTLPSDIDRAVQVIEHADAQKLGDAASEMLRPHAAFPPGRVPAPQCRASADKITQALREPAEVGAGRAGAGR